MPDYIKCFDTALEKYQNQAKQPGKPKTVFSLLRHSNKLYPHIEALKQKLDNTSSKYKQREILQTYFNDPKTTKNNHSFSIYLMIELDKAEENKVDKKWVEYYYPKDKRIKFYNGELYRGTLEPYQEVFKNGIERDTSANVERFAYEGNGSTGVSTTKSFQIAHDYARYSPMNATSDLAAMGAYGSDATPMYVYKIQYSGLGGIDIDETRRTRGENVTGETKQEVNIVGKIKPADIECVYIYLKGTVEVYKNPNFLLRDDSSNNASMAERLDNLFAQESGIVDIVVDRVSSFVSAMFPNKSSKEEVKQTEKQPEMEDKTVGRKNIG